MKTYKVTINNYGTICWYKEGTEEFHREDGPAVEYGSGGKSWYLNGKLHREDGPAVEYSDGNKFWYLNGKCLSKKEWKQQIAKLSNPTTCEDKIVVVEGVEYKLVPISGE
jgi:hypothetical protein